MQKIETAELDSEFKKPLISIKEELFEIHNFEYPTFCDKIIQLKSQSEHMLNYSHELFNRFDDFLIKKNSADFQHRSALMKEQYEFQIDFQELVNNAKKYGYTQELPDENSSQHKVDTNVLMKKLGEQTYMLDDLNYKT